MRICFGNSWRQPLSQHPFLIVDVGARGGPKPEWRPLMNSMHYVGFEPDSAECEALRASLSGRVAKYEIHEQALFEEPALLTLHVTRRPGLSSIYPPNQNFLSKFPETNAYGYAVDVEKQIQATTLDLSLSDETAGQADLLKVDVEGCSQGVLAGAGRLLERRSLIMIQVEAELNQKYRDEPLYGVVDQTIRCHPYELADMEICRWKRRAATRTAGTEGQPVHGDFLYCIETGAFFERLMSLPEAARCSKLFKGVVLACLYGVFDLAHEWVNEGARMKVFTPEESRQLLRALSPAGSLLARMQKLKNLDTSRRMLYHLFMLICGVWLDRKGYWKPTVAIGDNDNY